MRVVLTIWASLLNARKDPTYQFSNSSVLPLAIRDCEVSGTRGTTCDAFLRSHWNLTSHLPSAEPRTLKILSRYPRGHNTEWRPYADTLHATHQTLDALGVGIMQCRDYHQRVSCRCTIELSATSGLRTPSVLPDPSSEARRWCSCQRKVWKHPIRMSTQSEVCHGC